MWFSGSELVISGAYTMYKDIWRCNEENQPLYYSYSANAVSLQRLSTWGGSAVKWKNASEGLVGGVMPAEVVLLWKDLTTNWVSDLRISLEPVQGRDTRAYLRVTVWSVRFDDDRPQGYDYAWATRDFGNLGYSISPAQLFDLLIEARQGIEWVLKGQDPHYPTP